MKTLLRVHRELWPMLAALDRGDGLPLASSHQLEPGDWVWVKRRNAETLEPRWKGPYAVVLVTPTAVKVDGIAPWLHHSHVRRASGPEAEAAEQEWTVSRNQENPLKLRLNKQGAQTVPEEETEPLRLPRSSH